MRIGRIYCRFVLTVSVAALTGCSGQPLYVGNSQPSSYPSADPRVDLLQSEIQRLESEVKSLRSELSARSADTSKDRSEVHLKEKVDALTAQISDLKRKIPDEGVCSVLQSSGHRVLTPCGRNGAGS